MNVAVAVPNSSTIPVRMRANAGDVRRSALLDLIEKSRMPVVALVAPAGYGKTTVLAQLAQYGSSPVAWLSTNEVHNEPVVLCADIVTALHLIESAASEMCTTVAANGDAATLGALLSSAIEAMNAPVTLVIDQLENVTNPECLAVIGELALRFPEGSRLVVSSRVRPLLSTPQLRVQRQLLEIGVRDLAMDEQEGQALLLAAGIDPGKHDAAALIDRTEGWPAGLSLAVAAIGAGDAVPNDAMLLSGDHRFVADFVRAEFLDRLPRKDVSFLRRASILENMSGPLCDATLGITGSTARLDAFENRNLLMVPLDERREWYRFHRLFGEVLRNELQRVEPEVVAELHSRAAAWYHAHGRPEQALAHARAANDSDRVAAVLLDRIRPMWIGGLAETVRPWLEWVAANELLDRYGELAIHGSLAYAFLGCPAEADTWSVAAERSTAETPNGTDGSSMESLLAYLRAFRCWDGVSAMRSDAILASQGLAPTSPLRAGVLFIEGLSHLIEDDPERAERLLIRAADAAVAIGSVSLAAMNLAVLGQIAAARNDWVAANEFGERAHGLVGDGTFDEYTSSAPVFAFQARLAIDSGRIDLARTQLARAARLRPRLTYALPVISVITLLDMARGYLALTDRAAALEVLNQARRILHQRPGLGRLDRQVDDLRARVESSSVALANGVSLTAAELRLAPFLATHLTLQEIGDRLYISRSTAKTEAVAIYHKLGVGSRNKAVDKLREFGLIRPEVES